MARMVVIRHNSFNTFDFDLGIHDQSLWLLANGKWFNTVCGLPVFGHHASLMYLLLVPLVWIGAGPNLWNLLQVAALGLATIPVFLIARNRLRSEYLASAFGIAWLLLPTTTYLAWETFHPETMAVPFLLMAYHCCTSRADLLVATPIRRNVIPVCWVLSAMLWKEDVAVALIGLGILLIFRRQRLFGSILVASATLYFVVVGLWLLPRLSGGLTAYGMLYGELGSTPKEMIQTALNNPSLILERMVENNALGYFAQITQPLSYLSVLAPLTLLMGTPQFFINILTNNDFTWSYMFHYQAIPLVVSITAAIEGLTLLKRRVPVLARFAPVTLIVSVLASAYAWGMLPYASGAYSMDDFIAWDVSGWQSALEHIGPDDVISAQYNLVPHVTHREVVYTFPNPWIQQNFLSDTSKFVDECKIQWIIVQLKSLDSESRNLLASLVSQGSYSAVQTVAGVSTFVYSGPPCAGQ